jgi:hypothetical protein
MHSQSAKLSGHPSNNEPAYKDQWSAAKKVAHTHKYKSYNDIWVPYLPTQRSLHESLSIIHLHSVEHRSITRGFSLVKLLLTSILILGVLFRLRYVVSQLSQISSSRIIHVNYVEGSTVQVNVTPNKQVI